MLVDLDKKSKEDIDYLNTADYTIVGAGAAGILLATKLTNKGFKVHLIESGDLNINKESQNKVISDNKKMKDSAINGRKRIVGGTTTKWGGQSLPFDKIDFIYRDWIKTSGWPISYEDINNFYNEANNFMNIDQYGYERLLLNKLKIKDPFLDNNELEYRLSKWAPEPNFYKKYKDDITFNYTTIYNALLTEIVFSKDNSVSSINLTNGNKSKYNVKVNNLIIACGGIETTRILLLNLPKKPAYLGFGFMEHLHINVGNVIAKNLFKFQKLFNTRFSNLRKFTVRIMPSEALQETEKLVNCSALFDFLPKNNFDPKKEAYTFIKRLSFDYKKFDFKWSSFRRYYRILTSLIKSILTLIFYRFYYAPYNSNIRLNIIAEQIPDKTNKIRLSTKKDIYGNRLADMDWKIPHESWKSIVTFSNKLKANLENIDGVKVTLNSNICLENKDYAKDIDPLYHHMGGCRMSKKSSNGVVNSDLQVWGHPNLYVCSSAVFPTGSHSNPTLTILALACRLANKFSKH